MESFTFYLVSLGERLTLFVSCPGLTVKSRATSIYLVECPASADGSELVIEAYDVGRPVLDFCVLPSAGDVPLIWISADVAWPYDAQTAGLVDLVQLVTVSRGKVSLIVVRSCVYRGLILCS